MSKRSWSRARSAASVAVAGVVSFSVVGVGIAYASSARDSASVEVVEELSIGAIPSIRSGADIALPIDEYQVSAKDQNLILHAEHEAMVSCMARFGLDWDVPVQEVGTDGFAYDRLFGVSNLEEVKSHGYHAPESGGSVNADGSMSDPIKDANTVPLTEEQDAVSSGLSELTEVNGEKIPNGGCIAEARSKVGTQDDPVLELSEATIGYGAMQADKDPRVLKGFARWSGCMAESGYSYATPWDSNDDPSWSTAEATAKEIAVAVADVRCQQESNLLGLRVAVAAAWQREYMQAHEKEFVAMKATIADQRAAARSILVAAG